MTPGRPARGGVSGGLPAPMPLLGLVRHARRRYRVIGAAHAGRDLCGPVGVRRGDLLGMCVWCGAPDRQATRRTLAR